MFSPPSTCSGATLCSFWDVMILRSAAALGSQILWSEDLNPGQSYNGIRVLNPI